MPANENGVGFGLMVGCDVGLGFGTVFGFGETAGVDSEIGASNRCAVTKSNAPMNKKKNRRLAGTDVFIVWQSHSTQQPMRTLRMPLQPPAGYRML